MAHGEMIDGVWHTRFHDTKSTGGRFKRTDAEIPQLGDTRRQRGTVGSGGFAAARGRYHLYVSLACPWAHRTVIFRKLKRLEDVISMDVVEPVMGDEGWQFGPDADATR
jgi:putative glutathione S-transferase